MVVISDLKTGGTPKSIRQWLLRFAVLVCIGFVARYLAAQDATSGNVPTLHVTTNLALLDVYSMDVTGLSSAKAENFELKVDGRVTPVRTFAHGSMDTARPIQLWLLFQCPMPTWQSQGSSFFAGKASLLKETLDALPSETTVGVAHWCDDGVSRVDARPTTDINRVLESIETALRPVSRNLTSREGELALQATLKLIDYYARSSSPANVPIVVAIHSDVTAAPKREVDQLIGDVVSSSVTAFLISNDANTDLQMPTGPDINEVCKDDVEIWQVLHLVANTSGGTVFTVDHDEYADVLRKILGSVKNRVQLGFTPPTLDDKWHSVDVRWCDTHGGNSRIKLNYKSQYYAGVKSGRG